MNQRPLLVAIILVSVALSACNGKDCSEPPKPEELEERFVDRVEGYLDDADANDEQAKEILALARGLTPARTSMQKRFEPHRSAILQQLLSDTPDLSVIDSNVEDSAEVMLDFGDAMIAQGLQAHRRLTKKQRENLATELAESPEPFELDWKADAAVEVFLVDISASSGQKAMVRDELVSVERSVREVQKKQHGIRLAILPHVKSDTPNRDAISAQVRKGSTYSVALIQGLARTYVKLMGNLQPAQRKQARSRIGALKRCPAS